jgi:nitrogen fixation protein FixH
MMLVLSILLALVPLAGIAQIVMKGTIATVDGLFMSLILLTLSGILVLNAYLEARKKFTAKKAPLAQKSS